MATFLPIGFSHTADAWPTLRAEGGGMAVANDVGVRRLTPTECERLQGFPDDWTDVPNPKGKPMADSARYRMLGNAVAVPVFEWVFGRIAAAVARQAAA